MIPKFFRHREAYSKAGAEPRLPDYEVFLVKVKPRFPGDVNLPFFVWSAGPPTDGELTFPRTFTVEINPEQAVAFMSLSPHNGGMKTSHRINMAYALLGELAEAYGEHGDTEGTRRLRAMVARMVAELLYR